MYVTAELSFGVGDAQLTYGQATGLLVITGPDGAIAGIAIKVGAGGGIGLPDARHACSAPPAPSRSCSTPRGRTRRSHPGRLPAAAPPAATRRTHHDLRLGARASTASRNPNAPAERRDLRQGHHRGAADHRRRHRRSTASSASPPPSTRSGARTSRSTAPSAATIPFLGALTGTAQPRRVRRARPTGVVGRIQLTRGSGIHPGRRAHRPVPARDQHVRDEPDDPDVRDQEAPRRSSLRRLRPGRRRATCRSSPTPSRRRPASS